MRAWASAALLSAVILMTGCQASDPRSNAPDVEKLHAVELMRKTNSFMYTPYRTPANMLDEVDVGIVGEVTSVDVSLIEDVDDAEGAVIIGLEPIEEWKRAVGDPGDTVYFWVSRPANVGESVYREAFPPGMRIALFGFDAAKSSDTRFSTVVPEPVVAPVPQGVFIADQTGRFVSVWGDDESTDSWGVQSVDDLRNQAVRTRP